MLTVNQWMDLWLIMKNELLTPNLRKFTHVYLLKYNVYLE